MLEMLFAFLICLEPHPLPDNGQYDDADVRRYVRMSRWYGHCHSLIVRGDVAVDWDEHRPDQLTVQSADAACPDPMAWAELRCTPTTGGVGPYSSVINHGLIRDEWPEAMPQIEGAVWFLEYTCDEAAQHRGYVFCGEPPPGS